MRTLFKPRGRYEVAMIVEATIKYFKGLNTDVDYNLDQEASKTLAAKARNAYFNTYYLCQEFLSVYLGERFSKNGISWSFVDKSQQKEMLYTIERMVYYWNKRSGDSGIPPENDGASRVFDLDCETPLVPLFAADDSWMTCELVKSLMLNQKKDVSNIGLLKKTEKLTTINY